MKRKETRWYILWYFTSGMWFITFCRNFFYSETWDWIIVLQFFNIVLSLAAGLVNANRYKRRQRDKNDE